MTGHLAATAVLLGAAHASLVCAQTADKVVVIRSDFGHGRVGIGTGFFISSDGRVLTAYHVIHGARQLTVSHQGTPFSDVLIEKIAPNHDLATLRVGPLNGATPFLPLAAPLPSEASSEVLETVGHPDGNLYVRLETRMTSPGYRLSETILSSGQKPIFRLTGVKLIHLASIVYSGMSGAPVVSSRGAIGVLSGSRDEGGTLAWAIPSEYAAPGSMRAVNKRVSDIRQWDSLTLMSDGWKNLRHSITIDNRLASAFNEFFTAVATNRTAQERMIGSAENMLSTIQITRLMAEARAREGRDFNDRDSEVMEHFTGRVSAFLEAGNEWLAARAQLMARLTELSLLIEGQHAGLPSTQRNDSLRGTFLPSLEALMRRLSAADTAQRILRGRVGPALETIIASYANAEETPAEVAPMLLKLEGIFASLVDTDARFAYAAEAHLTGEVGSLVERILAADYDEPSAAWRWASGLGYELVIPAGWEQAGGAGESWLSELANELNGMGFVLDKVFGNRLGLAADSQSVVSFLAVARRATPFPRSAFDSLTQGAEQQAHAGAFEVERVHTNDLDALLSRGLLSRGERSILRCDAIVFGPSRTLMLRLTLPPDRHDLLAHCRAVVESATFN